MSGEEALAQVIESSKKSTEDQDSDDQSFSDDEDEDEIASRLVQIIDRSID